MGNLAPGFDLAQPWLWGHVGSEPAHGRVSFLCFSVTLLSKSINLKIKKLKKKEKRKKNAVWNRNHSTGSESSKIRSCRLQQRLLQLWKTKCYLIQRDNKQLTMMHQVTNKFRTLGPPWTHQLIDLGRKQQKSTMIGNERT